MHKAQLQASLKILTLQICIQLEVLYQLTACGAKNLILMLGSCITIISVVIIAHVMMIHGICKMNGADLDGNKVSPKDSRKIAKLKKFHVPRLPLTNFSLLLTLQQPLNFKKENIAPSPSMHLNLSEDFCLNLTLALEWCTVLITLIHTLMLHKVVSKKSLYTMLKGSIKHLI